MIPHDQRIIRRERLRSGKLSRIPNRRAEAGASLIEIMVVLVILVTGVFLAIRIFPAGFSTLQSTDNRSRAVRLATALLGNAQSNVANLPAGVLFGYEDTASGSATNGQIVTIVNQNPDSLTPYNSSTSPYFTDVNKTRFIQAEPVLIPPPSTVAVNSKSVSASVYLLRFGPTYMDPTVGTPANAPTTGTQATYNSYLNVTSAPLAGYTLASNTPNPTTTTAFEPPLAADGSDASTTLTRQTNYLVDYGNQNNPALIMFAPNLAGRIYEVSFSYRDSSNNVISVTNLPVTVVTPSTTAPVYTTGWQALPITSGGTTPATNVVPGSLSVSRAFTRIATDTTNGITWSTTDPYQYCLGSSNVNSSSSANIGLLYFNPYGASYATTSGSGAQGFTAYVSYAVLDWHIIRDDIQVPTVTAASNGLIPIRTTLDHIKRAGDTNPDNTIYAGIYADYQNAPDIDVYNRSTGAELLQGTIVRGTPTPATTSAGAPDYYVDTDTHNGTYPAGTIFVNTNSSNITNGAQLRILYKAEGDWAVALQKAYARYTPEITSGTPNTIATFPLINSDGTGHYNTFGLDTTKGRIYFPLCDLNKSVTVTLQYTSSLSGGSTSYVRVPATQFTIDSTDSQYPGYAFISLFSTTGANSSALSATDSTGIEGTAANWTVVGAITGVSVKARVIYKDNENVGSVWRVQDMDTFLSPGT